ncbi:MULTISPECIES: site-specific integrase [unclassified Pseudomonas]|uniref:site-specific integrase n=1 Tax=unclassified Pseudomonas TaxID=196821 RepID=UPI000BCC2365|nr:MULTISPECIES: tyrosine-type recombinase/integrase [unclassified Pseudomonas]PVZ19516.1 site-specific recombinase XerD [Pseudomonas sp. URIL14HWK12:I12]PVZ22899.1 site-specific recombinase XerD [Pseudomonas sp. URIL14HWK12:I10]PVZ37471.1 site-specific recombinase XerD [Pseudomonas sp. URIL14HWK12:I11]SNZ14873.1 Site-specific recombinase XerD [Pseudomonas sp. URIL14HWK12:I9]
MSEVARYLAAGTRDNTRRSYRAAIEHFEVSWGGLLPATADSVARYLADHAATHSLATLRQRLAALSQWHLTQGFADPVRTPLVRQVFKGIRALHPAQPRQATPLGIETLERVVAALEAEATDPVRRLRARRDQALVLLGFWRGLRSDELARLRVEHVRAQAGVGIELYLPRSKGDRQNLGSQLRTPALSRLCPVQAYLAWVTTAGLAHGPVFRGIDRWGHLADAPLHSNSLIPLIRGILERGGVDATAYSSHSLRRGFATWATANGWDLKSLMAYVGWKDVKSALRYIDPATSFGGLALEGPAALPSQ